VKYIGFEDISGWCAGMKIVGVTDYTLKQKDFPSLQDILQVVAHDYERCCVVVSTNVEEVSVNKWLSDHGFEKGPNINNWRHEGRVTNLWFYQIDKDDYPAEEEEDDDYYDEDD